MCIQFTRMFIELQLLCIILLIKYIMCMLLLIMRLLCLCIIITIMQFLLLTTTIITMLCMHLTTTCITLLLTPCLKSQSRPNQQLTTQLPTKQRFQSTRLESILLILSLKSLLQLQSELQIIQLMSRSSKLQSIRLVKLTKKERLINKSSLPSTPKRFRNKQKCTLSTKKRPIERLRDTLRRSQSTKKGRRSMDRDHQPGHFLSILLQTPMRTV